MKKRPSLPTASSLPVSSALIAVAVLASACTGSATAGDEPATETQPATTQPTSTTAEPSSTAAPAETSDADTAMIERIASGYRTVEGVWAGFVPNEHPTVVKLDSGDLIAINHPDPDALGDASAIELDNSPFNSLHRITNPTDTDELKRIQGFAFDVQLGGVSSFAIEADPSDQILDPGGVDFVATLLHEMFHRYQTEAFPPPTGNQDVEGYAYTPENLELAVLEERALKTALDADSPADRDAAARHLAALRIVRRNADARVVLDDDQEVGEGTARYLEHRLAGDDTEYRYNGTNWSQDLVTSFGDVGVKDSFGFGRWYASGAGILHLLDELDVDDVAGRVESGELTATVLAEVLGVTEADAPALVTEAREQYDPLGTLGAEAIEAAERAAGEPPIFGGEASFSATGPDGALDNEAIQCLTDRGVDMESAGAVAIAPEDFDACVGDASSGSDEAPTPDPDSDGALEITEEQLDCLAERGVDLNDAGAELSDADFDACLS